LAQNTHIMKNSIIHIAIADDHTLLRKALRESICQIDNVQVTLDAASGDELLRRIPDYPIDILLMDLFMPDGNGKDALPIIRERHPDIKVLMMSVCTEMKLISDLLDQGIYGFVSKSAEIHELHEAISMASKNKMYKNRILTEALYWKADQHSTHPTVRKKIRFSETQQKVFQLLWQEKTTQEIAAEIFTSVSTVEKIKQQLKEKTGAGTTLGLIKFALKNRIILFEPEDVN
jgi:DNA-binding NarL/FixJ family response regulator